MMMLFGVYLGALLAVFEHNTTPTVSVRALRGRMWADIREVLRTA